MKVISLRSALQTAVLVTAVIAAGHSYGALAGGLANQQLQAKLVYCKTCHGLSGQGFRGYFPIPRLAGQQPQYIENQLRAFIAHRRLNPVMFNVAHGISPSMIPALATSFTNLNPGPLGALPRTLRPLEKNSSRKDHPTPTFLRASHVMVRTLGVTAKFRDWQANCIGTP